MNIFDISKQLQNIFDELEENGGELTEELESQLAITQADFSDKVKSYTEVIKKTESEIDCIDKEITRLKELKESKQKAIDRLSKIIVWAIDTFGETSKSGSKYLDYGTGKISVRNTKKVETNDELISNAISGFFSYANALNYNKELEHCVGLDITSVAEELKNYDAPGITEEELQYILKANISIDVNLADLLEGNGFTFLKSYLDFVNNIKVKGVVNKTDLKSALEANPDKFSNIGTVNNNKTISIK